MKINKNINVQKIDEGEIFILLLSGLITYYMNFDQVFWRPKFIHKISVSSMKMSDAVTWVIQNYFES